MLKAMVFGHRGFIAWFYAVTWKLLQDFSKRTYGKYITHSLGGFFNHYWHVSHFKIHASYASVWRVNSHSWRDGCLYNSFWC